MGALAYASVEVKRLTADGMRNAARNWEGCYGRSRTLAHEIAQFTTGGEVETGAIMLVRREAYSMTSRRFSPNSRSPESDCGRSIGYPR